MYNEVILNTHVTLSTFVNRAQCSHLEPPFQTRRHFVAFGIELDNSINCIGLDMVDNSTGRKLHHNLCRVHLVVGYYSGDDSNGRPNKGTRP